MSLIGGHRVLAILFVLVHRAQGQTELNVPNSPLWPIFSQLLSTQTGRTVQDINTLGLSDPTINQLWKSYSTSLAQMSVSQSAPTEPPPPPRPTVPTTTPPPLPDLYQSSYSFSSNSNQGTNSQPSNPSPTPTKPADNTVLYNDIMKLINHLSSSSGGATASSSFTPVQSSTSAQDVMQAYSQLSASNSAFASAAASNPLQDVMRQLMSTAGSSTAGGTDYQALLQNYLTSATNGGSPPNSGNTQSSGTPTYQSLVDQYNSIMNQGGSSTSSGSSSSGSNSGGGSSASYEQLLQQYNQIMGGKTSGTSNSGTSGGNPSSMVEQFMAMMSKQGSSSGTPSDQLLQMYSQIMGANASATTTQSPPVSAQETFEKQLAAFFPQFTSLFAQAATGNTSTATASGDPSAAQAIFDTLLFAPASTTPAPSISTEALTGQNSVMNDIRNLVNSGAGSGAFLTNHVQNVFKTKASREMGCRFLPELLELEIIPTAPINCMNRCPFPYINSQRFGIYCVCCPPGVNEQAVGMMSLVRGTSYMETPLAVVS